MRNVYMTVVHSRDCLCDPRRDPSYNPRLVHHSCRMTYHSRE